MNKVDRPDARVEEVVNEVYELFLDLDADEEQIEFPIVYTNAKAGWASVDPDVEGTDLRPLLELLISRVPAPVYEEGHPLQARVTNLDADAYVGRLALCRVHQGRSARAAGGVVPPRRLDREPQGGRALRELRACCGFPPTRRGRVRSSPLPDPGDHHWRDDRRP